MFKKIKESYQMTIGDQVQSVTQKCLEQSPSKEQEDDILFIGLEFN